MASRRRGKPISGWVIVDKPEGLSSVQCMAAVRRITDAQKSGHGGTLDPLATGVLPIALGEATKTVSYVMDGRKTYRFRVRWGEGRDTDDAEGRVTDTSDVRPDRDAITAVLPKFEGEIEQTPPVFSAIKIDGQRAYNLARADKAPALQPRRVLIERLTLLDTPDRDHADLEAVSGKGTYMRALARDVALALGTVGYITALRRTAVGPFTEDRAIPLDKLRQLGHSDLLTEHVLPVDMALADIPALVVTETEAQRLRHGQAVPALPIVSRAPSPLRSRDPLFCATAAGRPVALARIAGGELRPLRVLNL